MTANSNVENEVKLYTQDHAPILEKLASLGAELVYPRIFEKNLRYENADNSLGSQGVVLRLRQDSRARLTYKDGGVTTDGIIARQELEVEVSDLDTTHLILERLGYHVAFTYEKYRTTYSYKDAEIVLDELPYGNFVEIEGDTQTIEDVIKLIDLTHARRLANSYTSLFNQVKLRLGLRLNDLTFENFAGITVPDTVFLL